MQIDTNQRVDARGEVKTRKEVLAEQNLRRKSKKKNGKKLKYDEKPFKEFYAKKGY